MGRNLHLGGWPTNLLLKAQGTGKDCPHKKAATLLPSFTVTPTATAQSALQPDTGPPPPVMEMSRFIQALDPQLSLITLLPPPVMGMPQFLPPQMALLLVQDSPLLALTPDHLHPRQVLVQAPRGLLETTRGPMVPSLAFSSKPKFKFESCTQPRVEER